MKLISKIILSIILIASTGIIISYGMFSDFALSSFDSPSSETSEVTDTPTTPEAPDYASEFSSEIEILQNQIQKKAKRYYIHGSVLVAYKDQVLYKEDFGYKDPTQKIPLTSGMSYQLASVSKQYTAAAILKLHEDKVINIDRPVMDYLPDFKFKSVRIRDLLKHRSGLWNYMYLTENFWSQDIAPTNIEVVDLLNTHAPRLNFPSGRYFSYSNTGYVVLGAIVEKVSYLSLGEYLKKEFLLPLCLDETFVEKTEHNKSNILNGYQPYGRSFIELPAGFHNNAIGDKGIYASPEDLFEWFKNLKNGKILSKESIDLMFGRNKDGKNKDYGMGFRLDKDGKNPVIYHNGLWDGFRNGLEYHPEQDLVVIVMTHTQNKRKRYFQKHLVKAAKELIYTAEKRQDLKKKDKKEEELVM